MNREQCYTNYSMKFSTRKAFTLIELMVVISIIGILVSISVFSYLTAQKKGRDSRRRQDLKAIQTALEQYYAEHQVYPTGNNIDTAFSNNQRPQDPKNQGNYVYDWSHLDTDSYCICAKLEATPGNANAPTSTTCNWASAGNYLCIQNQQ